MLSKKSGFLNGQVGRLRALENPSGVDAGLAIAIGNARTVAHQAVSSPHGVDRACDRIHEKTTDSEQDRPNQIIDLLLEFGKSSRCRWRPSDKDGAQRENDRHGSRNDDD